MCSLHELEIDPSLFSFPSFFSHDISLYSISSLIEESDHKYSFTALSLSKTIENEFSASFKMPLCSFSQYKGNGNLRLQLRFYFTNI